MTNQVIPEAAVEAAHVPNAELHARGIRFCPGCQATRLRRHSVGAIIHPAAVVAAAEGFMDAHEAAHKAWLEQPDAKGGSLEHNLRAALEAAAPHILPDAKAQALEDALIDFGRESVFLTAAQETMARFLRERIAELRSK